MRPRRVSKGRLFVALLLISFGILAPLACDRTTSDSGAPREGEGSSRPAPAPQSALPPIEDVVEFVKNLGTATLSKEAAGRLTFLAVSVEAEQIVGFDADGALLGPLATDPSKKSDLASTRSGDRIAFVRRLDTPLKRYDVVSMARDGSDKKILTLSHPDVVETERRSRAGSGRSATRYENLSFAPDGKSIALFAEMPNRREGVFRLDADGSKLESLVESKLAERGAVRFRFPCLSSDGLRFACSRRGARKEGEAPGGGGEIIVVSIGDRSEAVVHRVVGGSVWPLAFAPDDASLLCVEQARDEDGRLVVVSLAPGGAAPRTLATGRNVVGSFSPDGRTIVYSAERADSEDLYLVSVDGGEPRRLTRGTGRTRDPIWIAPRR